MTLVRKMYIGGQLVDGESTIEVTNPATETMVGLVASAGFLDIEKALAAAKAAVPFWSKTSVAERAGWMAKLRDAVIANEIPLRECIHLEMGKTWAGTQEDFDSLKNSLQYYADEMRRMAPERLVDREGSHHHELVHEPIGVAVAYLAWNCPLLNVAFKLGPAMAAGCPIIIKPSANSPMSAYAVGELCHQIGLPAGVVNILCTVSDEAANALSASRIPALLTLIGSTATGLRVMQAGATSIKRYSMELGGNAPVLVFADADLDVAADIVSAVKFGNAGQICVAPNRVFVEASVAAAFEEKMVARAKAVRVGWSRDSEVDMGPLIDARAWSRVDKLVKESVNAGASLLTGGGRPNAMEVGHFYAPTVLRDVSPEMRIYREEIFGPVVSLMSFTSLEDVLEKANDTTSGLTAYVFTKDLEKAQHCAALLNFGEIQINGIRYDIDLPHGGFGQSGIGHDCSALALNDYLNVKRISRALHPSHQLKPLDEVKPC